MILALAEAGKNLKVAAVEALEGLISVTSSTDRE